MANNKVNFEGWPDGFRIFLDDRDVTPLPICLESSDDEEEDVNASFPCEKLENVSLVKGNITTSSESITSETSSSSQFRRSLTSPVDLGYIEMPYSKSVMDNFFERFRTPSPKEEIIPMKISQARLEELMATKSKHSLTVTLSLKETSTFFLLDRPSLTALEDSEEAEIIKKDNAHYDYLKLGGQRKHTKNAETQTKWKVWKSKDVWVPAAETKDSAVEASTYDLYQSFKDELHV